MKTLSNFKYGNAVRLGAIYGSAIAAVLFGTAFATDRLLHSHYPEIFSGNADYFGVRMFLGLLLGVFVSYLLAASKRFALTGSLLAICAVGGLFAWFNTNLETFPSPFLAVLAIPAVLHMVAVRSEHQAIEKEVVPLSSEVVHVAGVPEAA